MSRTISLLDQVRIASPCTVPWSSMTGDARVRFCGQCQLNVYNVVEMNRDEAEALIREREGGRLCLRLHRRRDGTIITKDCPVGLMRARKRLARMVGAIAAMIAFVIGAGATYGRNGNDRFRVRWLQPLAWFSEWLDPTLYILPGAITLPSPVSSEVNANPEDTGLSVSEALSQSVQSK